jgi:hypothetical protein
LNTFVSIGDGSFFFGVPSSSSQCSLELRGSVYQSVTFSGSAVTSQEAVAPGIFSAETDVRWMPMGLLQNLARKTRRVRFLHFIFIS